MIPTLANAATPVPMSLAARLTAIAAMVAVVLASNILVLYPVAVRIGAVDLADLLTWGAFSYPFAFLVTDLTNRRFGAVEARRMVRVGFLVAVALSAALATPRVAVASGTAFLIGQMLDVTVFNRLRQRADWWSAPLAASVLGSVADTALFFALAFAPVFASLGEADAFALELSPLLGVLQPEAARWVSWALADLTVKLGYALLLLTPYRIALSLWERRATA